MTINSAVIGVGSNISPEENIARAEKEVALLGRFIRKSDFFYTKPLVYEKQNDFLNGVFQIETSCDYKELNDRLKKIENKLGRIRTGNKYGPRTIDLDTVIFNNQVKDKDVFERDFIKKLVMELLPELSGILDSSNYQNHFSTVHAVIEKILSLLPASPLSVFGLGEWFCDEEPADGEINILVIIKNSREKYEEIINQELIKSNLNKIESYPVLVKLFRQEDLEDKPAGRSVATHSPGNIRSFISQPAPSKLLYGKLLPISDIIV